MFLSHITFIIVYMSAKSNDPNKGKKAENRVTAKYKFEKLLYFLKPFRAFRLNFTSSLIYVLMVKEDTVEKLFHIIT